VDLVVAFASGHCLRRPSWQVDYELPKQRSNLPHFAGDAALRVEFCQGIIGRLSRSVQVDLDAEQRDRVIVDQLSDDDDCVDEAAAGDEVPVVVSLGVEAEQFIEAFAERFGDRREFDQQQVAR